MDLFPEEGAQCVAHQAVQDAAGLLGVHPVLVDEVRRLHRASHGVGRDLVETDREHAADNRQAKGDADVIRIKGDIEDTSTWFPSLINGGIPVFSYLSIEVSLS